MSKLQFSAKCRIKTRDGFKEVPALPYTGMWAVTRNKYGSPSVTHVLTGMKIAEATTLKQGRALVAILDALPFNWSNLHKGMSEFMQTGWYKWIRRVNGIEDEVREPTLAEHAEAWQRERGQAVPTEGTPEYDAMYLAWHTEAFAEFRI